MVGSICIPLAERGILRVSGPDARAFLQGLISNDIARAGPDRAIYAALLTPQGKFLFDFLIAAVGDELLLDVEAGRAADLLRRLTLYRLRSKVQIADASAAWRVFALVGDGVAGHLALGDTAGAARAYAGGVVFVDPRLARLGVRAIVPADDALAGLGLGTGTAADYDRHRLALGVPDGSRDIAVDKSFLLESNVDELNGIDYDKGCYVGQELTARTKFRGVVRKRLFRVDVDGPLPPPGTPILLGAKEAGTMRSGADGVGLALLRLEIVDEARASGAPLEAAGARLRPHKPDWVNF